MSGRYCVNLCICFAAAILQPCLTIVLPQAALTETASETKPVNVMLCDTPEHAVAYAAALHKGAAEDEAKDIVGRDAGIEACDKLVGRVSVEEEKTLESLGVIYKVTALKFSGVGKFRWVAIPYH
jgi:hypothetical protein